MSQLQLFPGFILTFTILFGCISLSPVECRPQDSTTTPSSVQNATKQLQSSDKDVIKEIVTSNATEISTKTSTTTKPPKLTTERTTKTTTKAPKVTSERTTVKTTIITTRTTKQTSTTTTKPKSSTQGTTKPTESPKTPVVLTKTPLRAERPESAPSNPSSKDVIVNKTEDQGAHNENVKSFLPDRQPDLGAIPGDFSDVDEEDENPTFRLKEPGFGTPKPKPPSTTPATTDEDKRTRKTWGGNCLAVHWQRCSNIKTWADFHIVYEKSDKDKLNPIKRNRKYDCWGKDENTYCLRNGWTVNRCHINCMANCNRDMFQKWEVYVSHDGACPLWKK